MRKFVLLFSQIMTQFRGKSSACNVLMRDYFKIHQVKRDDLNNYFFICSNSSFMQITSSGSKRRCSRSNAIVLVVRSFSSLTIAIEDNWSESFVSFIENETSNSSKRFINDRTHN